MAASKTAICQRALARLGCTTNVSDIDTDTSQEAKLCRIFYDNAVTNVLEGFDWPFANRTGEIPIVETGLTGKWASHYAYPSDAVRILSIQPIDSTLAVTYPQSFISTQYTSAGSFEIVGGTSNKFIATFYTVALLCTYIKNETNTALFPASFEDALVYRMASELALGLNKSMDISRAMSNAYLTILAVAKASQKNENNFKKTPQVITDRFL